MSTAESFSDYSKQAGLALKLARESQSIERADVAQKIALTPSQLRHLEEGQSDLFYNQRYYLQAAHRYADLLGIRLPEPPAESTQSTVTEPTSLENSSSSLERSSKKWWLISGALLGLIALGVVSLLEPQQPKVVAQPATEPTETTSKAEEVAASIVDDTAAKTPQAQIEPGALDGALINELATWVQIVSTDGVKTNLRPQGGETTAFDANTTAAITFGKPSTAVLTIRGQRVALEGFLVDGASPPRALVIIRDIELAP